jgi:hypothetical protein
MFTISLQDITNLFKTIKSDRLAWFKSIDDDLKLSSAYICKCVQISKK